MTDPVQVITGTDGVERRRSGTQERLRRWYGERQHKDDAEPADDTVDISDEAQKRADGSYRKSILEHLEDD